ncbi:hypothetical protein ACFQGE_10275 [Halomicroarcula sp. GCM10025817]|uniref:hypothetical protein n=1 Tax=Haloarcula TaxID=2237 RepID=UPI0023E89D47|nr:hypothetical protein [Halomicroarcula sp. SYNS111]
MDSREVTDEMDCFIDDDQRTAIVVHEEDGELLRIEGEGLEFTEIEDADHLED